MSSARGWWIGLGALLLAQVVTPAWPVAAQEMAHPHAEGDDDDDRPFPEGPLSDTDYATRCLTSTPPGFQPTRGIKWLYGAPGHSMYNHRRPPNDKGYDCRGGLPHSDKSAADWRNLSLNVTSRSRHPGGVNSLFSDGHVQFIKDTVNVGAWQALGSRNGGEVVSADAY